MLSQHGFHWLLFGMCFVFGYNEQDRSATAKLQVRFIAVFTDERTSFQNKLFKSNFSNLIYLNFKQTNMAYKGVAKMSEELAKDYIGFKLGRAGDASNNKTAKTLRRLASELEREHGDMFNNMLNAMKMSQCSDVDGTMFQNIAREMFADHKINWGRIAVLYTFAGQMAMYCDRHDMKSECANIPYWLSAFVNKNLSGWIENTGGWEALADHFPEKKDGNDMWWGNILCTVGLVAGAAGAALVFAR